MGDYNYFKVGNYVNLTIAGNNTIKYTVIDGSCGGKDFISSSSDAESAVGSVKTQINNALSDSSGAKNLWVINNLSSWLNDGAYYSVIGTAINLLSNYNINLVLADATSIPGRAFYNCPKLKRVDAHKVTSVGERAFYACNGLTNLTFRTVVNSTDVYAFSGLETNNVTLTLNTGQDGVDVVKNKWKSYTWNWIQFLY